MTRGSDAQRLAETFRAWVQCAHAVPLLDLHAALEVAFAAMGVERGARVVVSPFAGRWVGEVLEKLGLIPVFAPVRAQDLNLDPNQIEDYLDLERPVVLLSHFAGLPAAVEEIHDLVHARDGCVIQEGAFAMGARTGAGPIGSSGVCIFAAHGADPRVDRRAGILACEDWKIAERVGEVVRARGLHIVSELATSALEGQRKEERLWRIRQELGRVYDREFAARPLAGLQLLYAQPPEAASRLYYPVLIDRLAEVADIARRERRIEIDIPELMVEPARIPNWRPTRRGVAGLPIHREMSIKSAERVVDVLVSLLE